MKLKSNEPFWLVKNGLIHSYPSLQTHITTEIVVVGGGITGSLIAHQCIAMGYQTVLIDRREVANGSTSATTSMLQYEIDVPLYQLIEQIGEEAAVACYRACYDSIDDLGKIVKTIGSTCGFKKKESLYFAAFKKDIKWLKQEFEARKKHEFSVQWLDADEIEKKYGLANTYGGILSSQGGNIDAFHLAHDLLAYNHQKGLAIYDKTDIKTVDETNRGVVIHTEHGSTIKAKKIIYCTGFESVELIKDSFVNLISTYAMVSEQTPSELKAIDNTLFWNTATPYIYMRTTDDGRLLIGGEDEEFVDATKRDKLLNHKSEKLQKQLHKILPHYAFNLDFVWAGTFGETKDGLPYIGEHPDFKNTYFVLGFGGNGITFSVIGMALVASMLKGKTHPLAPYFRFRR